MKVSMTSDYLTSREVATILDITIQWVVKLVKSGHLKGQKMGRDYIISRASVMRYKEERDKRLNNQAEK